MRWEKERFAVIQRVRRTVRRWGMLSPGDLVVVAVSGGVDSLVLLDVLAQIAPLEGISLRVFHVDHGLRPDSAREAEHVERAARGYGLSFRSVRVEVEAPGPGGLSPEEAAREARYRAYEEELAKSGARRLATGHTADDRVETLLLRLFTGAGPRGLAGIPPVRGPYIRPLCLLWREEIERYARFLPFPPMEDPTNRDTSIPRNRIRHVVIPFLEENFPGARKVLLREAEALGEVWEWLEDEAREAEKRGVREEGGVLEVSTSHLLALPPPLRRELVARLVRRAGAEPDYHLLEDILRLSKGGGSASLDLSGGLRASREYGRLLFGPAPRGAAVEGEGFHEVDVHGEGEYPLPGGGCLKVELVSRAGGIPPPREGDPRVAWLDADRLTFPLRLRRMKPGDRFHPLGAPGTRKLQDFLVDLKVPRRERERVAVLESGGKIAWVVGYRPDERFKITPRTERALRCELL
ncbi:tRNA lysidine(34) synthetase TilS [Candidatus Solincola sp.]|nr:tRNA lysidine(34) synthetase TilS [Actinomycetota bacterium]MDI7252639.1 tRNA lysidine(34) synthetase TilS [Actinomycetota bacterium]